MTADPDLAALWDHHCRCEFETRNIDATMATMVAEPYVNHIPTMTGGVGFDAPHDFYANHFVGVNPPDLELAPAAEPSARAPLSTRVARGRGSSHRRRRDRTQGA